MTSGFINEGVGGLPMTTISNRAMPRLAAILFCSGWALGFLGFFDLISESSSMLGAIFLWILSALILIMDRVNAYQNEHRLLQSSWEDFEGDIDAEVSPLPDPTEVGLDLPL